MLAIVDLAVLQALLLEHEFMPSERYGDLCACGYDVWSDGYEAWTRHFMEELIARASS